MVIPRMMTIKETAEITHLPQHFIRQLVLQKKIVFIRAGTRYLINLERLIDYLNTGDIEADEVEMLGGIRKIAE